MEYLLRFFIYRRLDVAKIKGNEDIAPFLTENMHDLIKDENFDYKKEEKIFNDVFLFLDKALGEDSFERYDPAKGKFMGAVSIAQFEAIIPGLAHCVTKNPYDSAEEERIENLRRLIKDIVKDADFQEKRSQYRPILRMKELVAYSKVYFSEL